mmetsp:Transcript_136828/g.309143  ORF Transcript_136828/g.309143 Transcript_136828/m.309143 type:complete len:206 (-) Transcript_136828:2-619(-)
MDRAHFVHPGNQSCIGCAAHLPSHGPLLISQHQLALAVISDTKLAVSRNRCYTDLGPEAHGDIGNVCRGLVASVAKNQALVLHLHPSLHFTWSQPHKRLGCLSYPLCKLIVATGKMVGPPKSVRDDGRKLGDVQLTTVLSISQIFLILGVRPLRLSHRPFKPPASLGAMPAPLGSVQHQGECLVLERRRRVVSSPCRYPGNPMHT